MGCPVCSAVCQKMVKIRYRLGAELIRCVDASGAIVGKNQYVPWGCAAVSLACDIVVTVELIEIGGLRQEGAGAGEILEEFVAIEPGLFQARRPPFVRMKRAAPNEGGVPGRDCAAQRIVRLAVETRRGTIGRFPSASKSVKKRPDLDAASWEIGRARAGQAA